ncbi:MAG: ComF family protein [Prevotellaceae bacterium]|nr:ComF family protein [Prevotellaceae bacterium]
MKEIFASLWHLFFPHRCVVCGSPVTAGEEELCYRCNIDLPRTGFRDPNDNPVARMFWGKMPIVRATSYFYYDKGSLFRNILYRLKYEGQKELGAVMGRFLAAELQPSGFFDGIDVILPVPLHRHKLQTRGYNQSEWIARGIAEITALPIDTEIIVREKNNETQTHRSGLDRWHNVDHIFKLRHPERVAGKHVLIVDDVITTGSTATACADTLHEVEGIHISVLTLATVRA